MLTQFIRTCTFSLLAALSIICSAVSADTLICDDGILFLGSNDVVDDVLIRDGGVLLTDGAIVTGDIKIERGGALAATRTLIAGDVKGDRALLVDLGLCEVGGEVELKRTGGPGTVFGLLPSISIISCHIDGDLEITRSQVNSFNVSNNSIRGHLELSRNHSTLPIVVENNTLIRKKNHRK